jgi:hypothetical protein
MQALPSKNIAFDRRKSSTTLQSPMPTGQGTKWTVLYEECFECLPLTRNTSPTSHDKPLYLQFHLLSTALHIIFV